MKNGTMDFTGRALVAGLACGLLIASPALKAAEVDSELPDEQRDITEVIVDLRGKMESLARKLETGQPDEAKRLREAAERMRNARMDDLLSEVTRLLSSASFLEAIGRQDRVLTELDSIIKLLESSRFDGAAIEEKLDAITQAARETAKLSRVQESLLSKTRHALERAAGIEALKAVKNEVEKLRDLQKGLNEGKSPEALDPQADAMDAQELEGAAALVEKLLQAQERVERQVAGLPGKDLPIRSAREFAQRLDDLIEKAESVAEGAREALDSRDRMGAPEARPGKASERPSAGSKGKVAGGKESAPGDKSAQGKEAGDEGSPSPGDPQAGDAGKESSGSKESTGAKESTGSKESGSKESPGSDGSPEGTSGERADGKDSPAGAKGGASKDPKGSKEEGGRPRPGASDLERERMARDLEARRDALAKAAKELSGEISGLSGELPEDTGAEAKPSIERAAQNADRGARSLEEGDLAGGREETVKARDDLKKAREDLAQEIRRMEDQNAREAAGALQDEGVLERETSEGAGKLEESSRKGSSDSARSALAQGAEALRDAAKSMRDAAQSLEGGDRSGAREQGGKAGSDLQRAKSALDQGRKGLEGRTAETKKSELERKLARKTEEARKEVEELERKLRKKGEEGALGAAKEDLAEAGRKMSGAAQAGGKGEKGLAKKQGEEALQRLDEASKKLSDAEKEELERLEREKLAKEKKEQDELARLTRQVSKKLSEGSKGSDEAQGRADELGEAAESMDQAGEDLEKEDAASAEKSQKEALEKLQNAREKLEEEEERLAKLQREKEMLSMVAALGEAKADEEKILAETVKVHSGREERESRRQKLRVEQALKKLVADQSSLAERVDGLNAKLKEELARVFTFVLRNVSADMRQVSESLKELETGTFTQFLEKEVIQDLDRLIAVLKEQIAKDEEEAQQSPQEGPQMSGEDRRRLVPVVAELRMLREMQVDVNRGTRDLEDVRQSIEGKVGESWEKALNRLMQKQGSVTRMTVEIQKDFHKALNPEGEEGEDPPGEGKRPEGGEVEKKGPEEP